MWDQSKMNFLILGRARAARRDGKQYVWSRELHGDRRLGPTSPPLPSSAQFCFPQIGIEAFNVQVGRHVAVQL